MGAHNDTNNILECFKTGQQTINDPGANGTFDLSNKWAGIATIASGTRRLPSGMAKGTLFFIAAGGDVTVLVPSGQTNILLRNNQLGFFFCLGSNAWASFALAIGGVVVDAGQVDYDNDETSLTATTVQGAIDELWALVDQL